MVSIIVLVMLSIQAVVCGIAGLISTVNNATTAHFFVSWMFVCNACLVYISLQHIHKREVAFSLPVLWLEHQNFDREVASSSLTQWGNID